MTQSPSSVAVEGVDTVDLGDLHIDTQLHGGTKLTNDISLSGTGNPRMSPTTTRSKRSDTASEIPSFMVSAPGKVIVYGEHAVVYGKVGWPR